MSNLPAGIRALLGIAATALEEARKLPETLPHAVNSAPMIAMSAALQASMRFQQQLAEFIARGDEVLSHLHGTSEEPPAWATFDDAAEPASATANGTQSKLAAFDTVSFDEDSEFPSDEPTVPPVAVPAKTKAKPPRPRSATPRPKKTTAANTKPAPAPSTAPASTARKPKPRKVTPDDPGPVA